MVSATSQTPPKPDLKPGDRIGILGGGQLGRMLALDAIRLGLVPVVYCQDRSEPAVIPAEAVVTGAWDDEEALDRFAALAQVCTFEFENIPAEAVARVAAKTIVRPDPRALRIAQDRLSEKTFLNGIGIGTTGFAAVGNGSDLNRAIEKVGLPSVLKTRRMGYDGKGQVRLMAREDREDAWEQIGRAPAILEAFVSFRRELSVIVARGTGGQIAVFDPVENEHRNHVLSRTLAPALLSVEQDGNARGIAAQIVTALDYVGVMGVELFETQEGRLLVNEIAPRVHNSGHWTQDACPVSQFEQHVRAVAGWPLGDTERHSDAIMENLLGDGVDAWAGHLAAPGTVLHLYGKAKARAGRKMGHINRIYPKGARPH